MQKLFAPDLLIPAVRKCPACRMRQRLSFRNERKLYRRACALTGKPIISLYRLDSPFVVYDQNTWWSDQYDPFAYGQDVDFSKPFFTQLKDLHQRVPKLSVHNSRSENCEYTNYSAVNRNCYLAVGALGAEDCLYSYRVFYSKNIIDSFGLSRCELCYECSQGADLYQCVYATNCQSSSNLFLCDDCIGCRDCFGCVNLRNQHYCIFNQRVSAEEYRQRVGSLRSDLALARDAFRRLRGISPVRCSYTVNCEDSFGDQLRNCRRCHNAFFIYDSEDVLHSRNGDNNRDCADINFGDNCELQFQAANLEKNYRVAFAALAWYMSDSFYVLSCFNSKHLFGCCGMKKNEYCILNQQYSPADYETMVRKIVSHMTETGEWGCFFPQSMSPFLFNETVAAEVFPLSEGECVSRGYNAGSAVLGPESRCEDGAWPSCKSCGRSFRIISQEKKFYSDMLLALPDSCPDCRHAQRIMQRRPMELRPASCAQCAKSILTSAPAGEVLCEECFTGMSE